jgi:hypothetical protein
MSVPKRGEPPATIYSGTIDFYTIGEITKKLIEIDKNKREKQNKKNDEQLKKGGASVEF